MKNEDPDPIEIDDSNDEDGDDIYGLRGAQNGRNTQTVANGPLKMVEVRIQLDRCDADHRNNSSSNSSGVNGSAEVINLNSKKDTNEAVPTNLNENKPGRNAIQPYKCEQCDFASRHLGSFKVHRQIHVNGRFVGTKRESNGLYHCTHCIRQFINIGLLSRHMGSVHKNDRYLHHCARCLRQFTENAKKKQHESQCEGHYFQCHLCKVFVTRNEDQMQFHMRVHSGAKPFRCMVCNECFPRPLQLRYHLNTVHDRNDS